MATKYFYCDGYDLKSVNVTAVFGNCSIYRTYNDGVCSYQTWSKNITFTLSSAIAVPLNIRYRYYQMYYQNNDLVWQGWVNSSRTIPAGSTSITFEDDCKENRYCSFNGSDGNYYPAAV